MSTSPIQEVLPDAEVIELEPTLTVGVAEPWSTLGNASSRAPAPDEGSLASLAGEIHSLRRNRIAAAALFLALAYGVVLIWRIFGSGLEASSWYTLATSGGLRFAIAAAVAGLLLSRVDLTRGQVYAAEYVLFGSVTIILAVTQYTVNLDLSAPG